MIFMSKTMSLKAQNFEDSKTIPKICRQKNLWFQNTLQPRKLVKKKSVSQMSKNIKNCREILLRSKLSEMEMLMQGVEEEQDALMTVQDRHVC